jgi:hypothetical protein
LEVYILYILLLCVNYDIVVNIDDELRGVVLFDDDINDSVTVITKSVNMTINSRMNILGEDGCIGVT